MNVVFNFVINLSDSLINNNITSSCRFISRGHTSVSSQKSGETLGENTDKNKILRNEDDSRGTRASLIMS